MPLDNAGNTLNTARKLALTTNIQTLTDWVGSSDIDDFYSFNLTGRSSVNITLDGLSADANIRLIKDANSNGFVENNETIVGSYKSGTQIDSIQRNLDPGNYFIKVYFKGSDTNYNLKVFKNVAPTSLQFNLNSTSLNTTDTLSINNAWVSDANGVSDISKVDFRIQKPGGKWLDVADATLFTPDASNGNRASFSYSLSLKNLNFGAGQYILQGIAYDHTSAASNVFKQTFAITEQNNTTMPLDNAGNTLNTARKLALTTNIQTLTDWVGSSDIDDFYSFNLTGRSSVNITLDGLSADANIRLIKDANSNGFVENNETIVGSYKSGTQIDSIQRTLDSGNYFIKVYFKGSDTNYNLKVFANTVTNTAPTPIPTPVTTPAPTPVTTPAPTPVQDWFSQNLLDQQIVTLARNLAFDGDLNRQDMLDIFRNAQDNSAIDLNEVKDLKALIGASSPFTMQDSVKWLSTKVANGATVDMAASKFESNLVGRWFLGTIAPTPVFNGKNLTYTLVTGNLFGSSGEARIGDIDQNKLGDCTFLAALGATFGRQSNDAGNASSSLINNMITDNGDNTYTVRFYSTTSFDPGEAQYVTVDRRIATSIAAKRNNGVLWVALLEKAYAQWREGNVAQPGYNLIGNGGSLSNPLRNITGKQTTYQVISKVSFSSLETALANSEALTAARVGSDSKYIVGYHAYSVTNTYTNTTGQQRVVVRNPWGVDGRTLSGSNDGFIDLSFDEFTQSFNYGITFA